MMIIKKRPAIWIAESGFIAISILMALWGYKELAGMAIGAFAALAHKLVESEEKSDAA